MAAVSARNGQAAPSLEPTGEAGGFRHTALWYSSADEFSFVAADFVAEGLAAGEPVLVAVDRSKIDLLERALGHDAERVSFVDMAVLGANPARIIPAWERFLDQRSSADVPVRGIGEPIWPGRDRDELVEAQRHEVLLNAAFAATDNFQLLCPYDVSALDEDVVTEAARSHRHLVDAHDCGSERPSDSWRSKSESDEALRRPLEPPPSGASQLTFAHDDLAAVRAFVEGCAGAARIGGERTADFVLAVNEVATNSLRHGGGRGTVQSWPTPDGVVCEVRDCGTIADPLVDRRPPGRDAENGRGLWIANQLCDLVQVRSGPGGTVVRLHLRAGRARA